MRCMIPLCLLCLVFLQQNINVTSILLFKENPDNELMRSTSGRRLRAPLMGRSIITTKTTIDDGINLVHSESDGNNSSNENKLSHFNKRRYGLALFGRQKLFNLKRKGPLFG